MGPADLLLYALLILIKKTIEVLPRKTALGLGSFAGSAAYLLLPRRRGITLENLRRAFPDRGEPWCRITGRSVFENLGRNVIELLKYASGRYFDAVRATGTGNLEGGSIIVTGHLGHWEITGMNLAVSGIELHPLARRVHNPAFERIVRDLRTSFGGEVIRNRNSLKEVLRKLRRSGNIYMLVDQRIKSGIPVPFMGRPVWATHLPSVLYRKTGVKVIPASSRHTEDGIHIEYGKPFDFVSGDDPLKADFINTGIQMKWLEDKVRSDPREWFWLHNFWKGRWRAVFIDRDGTINRDTGYVSDKESFEILPGALEGIRLLRKAGYLIVIVTNQSGIARGYYSEADYRRLTGYMLELFSREGVIVDRVLHCPHHPDDGCSCRKPRTGMGLSAAADLNIDLGSSFVVGDKLSDVSFGRSLSAGTVLIGNDRGSRDSGCAPDHTASTLLEAAEIITSP